MENRFQQNCASANLEKSWNIVHQATSSEFMKSSLKITPPGLGRHRCMRTSDLAGVQAGSQGRQVHRARDQVRAQAGALVPRARGGDTFR